MLYCDCYNHGINYNSYLSEKTKMMIKINKRARGKEGKKESRDFVSQNRNLLTSHLSRLTKYTLHFALCTLLFAQQCYALPWSNKPLPRLNTQQKIGYVNINWWDNFSDPYLKCYIIQAIENNHDAKEASWSVEEFKQNVKLQFSQELPSLSVGTNYILNHLQDIFKGTKTNVFAVPFLASYEADIFLKNHDKTKSSKKTYEASQFQEQSIYISLASDVATTYINLIKYDKQIQIQQKYVKAKQEELKRAVESYKNGVVSIPDVNRAKEDYQNAKSDLDEFIKSRDKSLNQLALLIGESAENAKCLKRGSWDDFKYDAIIPDEICSDVIFSRPDVLMAERELEKANIDVRVARKEFLPRFNIVGIYAFTNLGSTAFGTWNSTLAALFTGATLDLFKGGYKVANLKANKARYEQMFEAYRQADLNAIKEVNDSLVVIKQDTLIDDNTTKNLITEFDNYQRARNSYKNGVISYPDLLSEEENYLMMKQNQVNSKTARLVDYITLYKAAGGKL